MPGLAGITALVAVVVGYCIWFAIPPDAGVFTARVGRDDEWVRRFVGPPTRSAGLRGAGVWFYDRPVRTPQGQQRRAALAFRGTVCTAVAFED